MREQVLARVRAEKGVHVERLKAWLRIPSVSTDPAHKEDVRQAARFIAEELKEAGFQVRIEETPGHPVVLARWEGASEKPTILVYGHYDVQPPDPVELWRHGPFEPVIEGTNIVARGATDDKGQSLALLRGIGAYLRVAGRLPVNVIVLLEGEEEIGSPHLEPFLKDHREELRADAVLIADCSQFGPGMPALTIGLKGLAYLEVTVQGAKRDLHSGSFGGAVENPAHVLCRLLGSLKDETGRITIPGFYDDVVDLTPEEREEIRTLPFDEEQFRRELGVPRLHGEEGYTTLERTWARPTLDINGLVSGWTGPGAKTVLPARATGKFSMRLVPNQEPEKIQALAAEHLRRLCPDTVTLEITYHHGAKPVLVDRRNPFLQAAARALAQGFGKEPVFIREGGSIPVVATFKELLGVDSILMGLGLHDDGAHGPNEKFSLEDFQRGIETVVHFLEEAAQV